ncbi:hypothetical protein DFH09DRAFT_1077438 [Mycena vulgaris]|nr:hypothetical protein DFH09DRAFT_1077438 [Mycena vulgaris]
MPTQPTTAQIRSDNILMALSAAVATFEVVTASLKAPLLEPISRTTQSLLAAVQAVKKNNEDVTRMLEQIHELLYEIIRLHMAPDTGGELSLEMLNHLRQFTETLHKIHTFVEAQQEKSRIKKFFRQGEMNTLLKGCKAGLEEALETLKVYLVLTLRTSSFKDNHHTGSRDSFLEGYDKHAAIHTEDSPGSPGVDLIPFRWRKFEQNIFCKS